MSYGPEGWDPRFRAALAIMLLTMFVIGFFIGYLMGGSVVVMTGRGPL